MVSYIRGQGKMFSKSLGSLPGAGQRLFPFSTVASNQAIDLSSCEPQFLFASDLGRALRFFIALGC
jgi:hypothetical protein